MHAQYYLLYYLYIQQYVELVTSDSSVLSHLVKVVLSYVTKVCGALCVMTPGAVWTLRWSADSWDSLLTVRLFPYGILWSSCIMTLCLSLDALAIPRALLGAGNGQIWLDNVNCRGTEARLIDCVANPIGTHNCAHTEDAGVRCSSKFITSHVFMNDSFLVPSPPLPPSLPLFSSLWTRRHQTCGRNHSIRRTC